MRSDSEIGGKVDGTAMASRAGQTHVRIGTLGRFAIEVDGAELRLGRRANTRPLELLQVLIALGGRDVHTFRLADALWPGSDGDSAQRTLSTNLHRLRKLIGRETLRLEHGQLSLVSAHCGVDAQELETLWQAATTLLPEGKEDRAWAAAHAALELYRGPFLVGESEHPLVLKTRERIQTQHLRSLALSAEQWQERQRPERAVTLLEQGLVVDELAEELYRRLMVCHRTEGRLAEALSVYERCHQALARERGTAPSTETEQLRRLLLSERGAGAAHPPGTGDHSSGPRTNPVSEEPKAGALPEAASMRPERRLVTVLDVALCDASELAARYSPEEGDSLLNQLRATAERISTECGGLMLPPQGAHWVALFGARVTHDDDPVRAARAARLLHSAAGSLELRRPGLVPFRPRLRSAIASGLMVASARSWDILRQGLTGAPVTAAAELAAQAPPDGTLVDSDSRLVLAPYYALSPWRSDPVPDGRGRRAIFRLGEETVSRTRFDAARRAGLTPLSGRQREQASLHACLERAEAGQGQFIAITGEPGIGKSRLCHEFLRELDVRPLAVHSGRCQPYGRHTPYLPFVQVLQQVLTLPADRTTDPPHTLAERLHVIDPALDVFLPHYTHLLGEELHRDVARSLPQGAALRRALQESVTALLLRMSRQQPLVLLLEDWHWADEDSDAALKFLAVRIAKNPLLVLVAFRPEYDASWARPGDLTVIGLGSLAQSEGEAMVRSLLPAPQAEAKQVDRVLAQSGGNPLFIEEVCRHLLERGPCVPSVSSTLQAASGFEEPPLTVQAVIRARLERLHPAAYETLRVAAVIGAEFDSALLAWLTGDPAATDTALDQLIAHDLVQESTILPERTYRFKHALTQMVAYESMLLDERRTLHDRVGRFVETASTGALDTCCELLAHHYRHGRDTARALTYLEMAGDKASRSYAHAPAREHYREAIRLLDASAPDDAAWCRRIDLSLKWAAASYYVTSAEVVEVLGRSLELTGLLRDDARRARVGHWMGRAHHVSGQAARALACLQEALAIAERLGDDDLCAHLNDSIGRACVLTAEFKRGMAALKSGLPLLRSDGDPEEVAYSISFLGLIHANLGDFALAFALQDEALSLTRATGNLTYESSTLVRVAICAWEQGEWTRAHAAAQEARAIGERIDNGILVGVASTMEGVARFQLGKPQAGLRLALKGVRTMESARSRLGFSYFLAILAECYALAGNADEAATWAERSLQRAAEGEVMGEHIAERALGIAASRRSPPDWDRSEQHFATALDRAEGRNAWPELAVTHYRLAQLCAYRGLPQRCRQHSAEALAQFEALDMPAWARVAATLVGDADKPIHLKQLHAFGDQQ